MADCGLVCEWYQAKKLNYLSISNNPSVCSSVLEVTGACDTSQCPKGDITLNSQVDVSTLVTKYGKCDSLPGSLSIYGEDITDISGLAFIKIIKGRLGISGCKRLKNINGFANLHTIGGSLNVTGNDSLQHIQGLKVLRNLGDEIRITQNNALESLVGLEGIVGLKDGIIISQCPKLVDLTGLPIVKTLPYYIYIEY